MTTSDKIQGRQAPHRRCLIGVADRPSQRCNQRYNSHSLCRVGCSSKLATVLTLVSLLQNIILNADLWKCQRLVGIAGNRHRETSRPLLSQLFGLGSSNASQISSHNHNGKLTSITKTGAQPSKAQSNGRSNPGPQSMVRAQAGNPGTEQVESASMS